MLNGSADSARVILTTVAAAIITVIGIVFSITIVVLTLASTQFGPRMLRNCVRDPGTQVALGAFVATFCYTMITLVSVGGGGDKGEFVPHLSITVSLVLTMGNVGVLIYFLNHVAVMIQLPVVIASIARTLNAEIESQNRGALSVSGVQRGPSYEDLLVRLGESGAPIRTPRSGYLQVIRMEKLVKVASKAGAVVELPYRPGHFFVAGQVMARVWPASAAARGGEESGFRPYRRCVSHAAPGYFVRSRPVGRDRPACVVTRGQRHIYGHDVCRLDRRRACAGFPPRGVRNRSGVMPKERYA